MGLGNSRRRILSYVVYNNVIFNRYDSSRTINVVAAVGKRTTALLVGSEGGTTISTALIEKYSIRSRDNMTVRLGKVVRRSFPRRNLTTRTYKLSAHAANTATEMCIRVFMVVTIKKS